MAKKESKKRRIYEAKYTGPFAEGTGIRVGNNVLRSIFPRAKGWVQILRVEYDAMKQMGDFKVRQRYIAK